jgi:peroxiredoxin
VLSDIDHGYTLSLNLAIWIGEEMRRVFETIEIRLPDYQRSQAWLLPIPATFVVGRQGLITARFVDPDYTRRMDIDDLLAALAEAR